MGDINKGKEITFHGYQAFGVSSQYIDVFLQGIQHKKSAKQASQFLKQSAENGEIPAAVLLQMYEQLGDVDGYFQLVLQLAKNNQYDVLSSRRFNANTIRNNPHFLTLMTQIGLTQYWQKHGDPYFDKNAEQAPSSSL